METTKARPAGLLRPDGAHLRGRVARRPWVGGWSCRGSWRTRSSGARWVGWRSNQPVFASKGWVRDEAGPFLGYAATGWECFRITSWEAITLNITPTCKSPVEKTPENKVHGVDGSQDGGWWRPPIHRFWPWSDWLFPPPPAPGGSPRTSAGPVAGCGARGGHETVGHPPRSGRGGCFWAEMPRKKAWRWEGQVTGMTVLWRSGLVAFGGWWGAFFSWVTSDWQVGHGVNTDHYKVSHGFFQVSVSVVLSVYKNGSVLSVDIPRSPITILTDWSRGFNTWNRVT